LLPAVIAAAVAVIAASLLIGALRDHPILHRSESGPAVGADVATAALWHTDSFPVGASGHLSKKERVRFDVQKERVRVTVRDLSDALALDPGRMPDAVERLVTKAAAPALLKAAPSMPKDATEITAIKRTGRIGLQAPRFAAAAAEVNVIMQASFEGRIVKWRNHFDLWLERADGEWRVIAFDLDRTQLR
jgi:hypothetical protein